MARRFPRRAPLLPWSVSFDWVQWPAMAVTVLAAWLVASRAELFSVETVDGPTSGTTFKFDDSVSGSTLSIGTVQYFPPAWVGATETVSVVIF